MTMGLICIYSFLGIRWTQWKYSSRVLLSSVIGTPIYEQLFIELPGMGMLLATGFWGIVGLIKLYRSGRGDVGVMYFVFAVIGFFVFVVAMFPLWDDASP